MKLNARSGSQRKLPSASTPLPVMESEVLSPGTTRLDYNDANEVVAVAMLDLSKRYFQISTCRRCSSRRSQS